MSRSRTCSSYRTRAPEHATIKALHVRTAYFDILSGDLWEGAPASMRSTGEVNEGFGLPDRGETRWRVGVLCLCASEKVVGRGGFAEGQCARCGIRYDVMDHTNITQSS